MIYYLKLYCLMPSLFLLIVAIDYVVAPLPDSTASSCSRTPKSSCSNNRTVRAFPFPLRAHVLRVCFWYSVINWWLAVMGYSELLGVIPFKFPPSKRDSLYPIAVPRTIKCFSNESVKELTIGLAEEPRQWKRLERFVASIGRIWPPRWSSGQRVWLLITRSRVRSPALPQILNVD